MTPPTLRLESALVVLVAGGVAATLARAARGPQRHRVAEACRSRGRPADAGQIMAECDTLAFLASSVVVVAALVATLLAGRTLAAADPLAAASGVVGWIGLAWLVLVAVPVVVAASCGAALLVGGFWLWRPLVALVSPMVAWLGSLGRRLAEAWGAAPAEAADGDEELRAVVAEAHRDGRLAETARDMIAGVMDLAEARVGRIMTKRTAIVSLPLDTRWDDAVRLAADSGHTRLPVWGSSPDDVIGILHTRELLVQLTAHLGGVPPPDSVRSLLRPPFFIPESMSVQKLLRELQRTHTHIAIVTDEFGGVAGLVTIEDALEEIVGEIADEHDEVLVDGLRRVADDIWEASGQVPVREINTRMGLDLPEEDGYETVGGLVFHQCGRVPQVGESIAARGAVFEVLAASGRRVERVRVSRR
jgi:CBS domain containing-hemolysin-like protein